MHTISIILRSTDKVIQPHKHKFDNTREAAKWNMSLLKRDLYDFTKILRREQGTMMEQGSEFRPNNILQHFFCQHEHWPKITSIISEGVLYPLSTTNEAERKADIIHMISKEKPQIGDNPAK